MYGKVSNPLNPEEYVWKSEHALDPQVWKNWWYSTPRVHGKVTNPWTLNWKTLNPEPKNRLPGGPKRDPKDSTLNPKPRNRLPGGPRQTRS
jgi:hypothetical protein